MLVIQCTSMIGFFQDTLLCVEHYILGDLVFSVKSSKETCLPDSTTDTSSRSSGQTANRPTCTQIHNLKVMRFKVNLG